jgi:hypothetical protein
VIDEDQVKTAREVVSHSTGTPEWSNPRAFEKDVFTFARAIFKVGPNLAPGYGYGRRFGWWVDFPDADLNLSYRLQQMTSMKVDPNGRVLKLTDPELHDHPFLFMEHPGYIILRDPEVEALRKYLHAGGVLAVIDMWNNYEWAGFSSAMKKVLPDREWTELTMDHPLFHCVFDLAAPAGADDAILEPEAQSRRPELTAVAMGPWRRLGENGRPRAPRRQGPHHGDCLPQHRHHRWLGAGGRAGGFFSRVLRARRLSDGR